MRFQLGIGSDRTLCLGQGQIDRFGPSATQHLGRLQLDTDIKGQTHILPCRRLKITQHTDRATTGIDLNTLAAWLATQLALHGVFNTNRRRW